MERYDNLEFPLPKEINKVVWRIVGNNESPLSQETTSQLIERTVRKYARDLPSARQDGAIAVIHGWFEFHGEKGWLKEDLHETVAYLIADGFKDALWMHRGIQNQEAAFCAVGSIDPDLAVNILSSSLTDEELDTFVNYAFKLLNILCERDAILRPDRGGQFESAKTKVSLSHLKGRGGLENLLRLRDYEWQLNSSVANMVEFLVKLNPEHFYTLVGIVDDPLIHLRAARCVLREYVPSGQHEPFQWLVNRSSDALVALAIVHILWEVGNLDSDIRRQTENKSEKADRELTGSDQLSRMIGQLHELEPIACARWVCELLSGGISVLHARVSSEKPARVMQLEELCTQLLKRIVQQSWSEELLDEFRIGMCETRLVPRTLPLAHVAFDLLQTEPTRSAEIARLILGTHLRQVIEVLERKDSFFYDMSHWTYRDWVESLSLSLLLSDGDVNLAEWVSEGCRALPLSAWDAEEDYERFLIAERVAKFRFLVALHAFQMMKELGRAIDPDSVRSLAEQLWAHCQFVSSYVANLEDSGESAYAGRVVAVLGEPSDEWVLDQARNRGVGPHTLWALIDQVTSNGSKGFGLGDYYEQVVKAELREIASHRFSGVRGFDLPELCYLGKLWLSLDAVDEARKTAMAIVSIPQQKTSRGQKILALKLLALGSKKRRLDSGAERQIASLYSELWTSYTPSEELTERQEIDDLLIR